MILALYGAGSMGREFKYMADATGEWDGVVFIDDNAVDDQLLGCPVYRLQAFLGHYRPEEVRFVVSMGEPKFRREGFERLKKAGYRGGVLIDPSAQVSPDAVIGEGVAVCPDAIVGSLVEVNPNVYISVRAAVGHDSVVGAHSRIGAGAFIGGHVRIGEGAFIGSGALLRDRIKFGDQSIAGLGAAVFSDVPPRVTVIGNPARISNENGEGYLYSSSAAQSAPAPQRAPEEPEPEADFGPEQIIVKYFEVFSGCFEGIDFNPAAFHYQDTGWDSAAQMILISRLEEAFGLHFGGREILRMTSFQAGLKMIQKKLAEAGRREP